LYDQDGFLELLLRLFSLAHEHCRVAGLGGQRLWFWAGGCEVCPLCLLLQDQFQVLERVV
jgi:hypothetical protein